MLHSVTSSLTRKIGGFRLGTCSSWWNMKKKNSQTLTIIQMVILAAIFWVPTKFHLLYWKYYKFYLKFLQESWKKRVILFILQMRNRWLKEDTLFLVDRTRGWGQAYLIPEPFLYCIIFITKEKKLLPFLKELIISRYNKCKE